MGRTVRMEQRAGLVRGARYRALLLLFVLCAPSAYAVDLCQTSPDGLTVSFVWEAANPYDPGAFFGIVSGCGYRATSDSIEVCWQPSADDGLVRCVAPLEKAASTDADDDGIADVPDQDATSGSFIGFGMPPPGCGTISGPFGSESYCFYNGEGPDNEVPEGWHATGNGVAPGPEVGSVKSPEVGATEVEDACPPGYTYTSGQWPGATEAGLCVQDSHVGGFAGWFNPNLDTGPDGGDGAGEDGDGFGCEDAGNILACLDASTQDAQGVVDGFEAAVDDVVSQLGDAVEVPELPGPGLGWFDEWGGVECPDFGSPVLMGVTFDTSGLCDYIETGRSVLEFIVWGFFVVYLFWAAARVFE